MEAVSATNDKRKYSTLYPARKDYVSMDTSSRHTRATSSPPIQNEGTGWSLPRQRDSVSVRRMQMSSAWQHGTTRSRSLPRHTSLDRAHIPVVAHTMRLVLQDSPASCACVTADVINSAEAVSKASITSGSKARMKSSMLPAPTACRNVRVTPSCLSC